ncbi:MAG: Dihydrolipoamide acetyltransferase component of pyruvate dehydrogenase complex [Chthonomonadaceae bacterium]|nr:Dihydrolipoamide acetyltransferase component of pyruvate dehydrogenase complex [Chthonomonadaceae bacterium]
MAQLFNMPQLGSTMEEGTILKWHKNEGDPVRAGELLLEIETDKASMEVEAPADGVVRRILALADAIVPIRQPIAILAGANESIEALLAEAGVGTPPAAVSAPQPAVEAPSVAPKIASLSAPAARGDAGPVFISPRARRIADEKGVAVALLAGRGTGPQGRVIERDVEAFVAAQAAVPVTAPTVAEPAGRSAPRTTPLAARMADDLGIDLNDLTTGLPGSRVRREDVLRHAETNRPTVEAAPVASPKSETAPAGVTVLAFGGMRKRIADNVAKSAFAAPHVTLTLEVDMTACAEFRTRLIPDVEKAYGTRLSFTDVLVKATARALGEHPLLNAALVGNEVHLFAQKNIGVAVALEEGLIVPVVKGAEQKSLGSISAELKQLVERSRTGKFTPDDLSGGTFTITNLGSFGIDVFDPIIVTGQAAILGVCRIADKPVVVQKEVVVRSMMNLCLSFDHRILDGAPAARFLQRLKELLENPMLVLI